MSELSDSMICVTNTRLWAITWFSPYENAETSGSRNGFLIQQLVNYCCKPTEGHARQGRPPKSTSNAVLARSDWDVDRFCVPRENDGLVGPWPAGMEGVFPWRSLLVVKQNSQTTGRDAGSGSTSRVASHMTGWGRKCFGFPRSTKTDLLLLATGPRAGHSKKTE